MMSKSVVMVDGGLKVNLSMEVDLVATGIDTCGVDIEGGTGEGVEPAFAAEAFFGLLAGDGELFAALADEVVFGPGGGVVNLVDVVRRVASACEVFAIFLAEFEFSHGIV